MRHWMLLGILGVGACSVAPATPGGGDGAAAPRAAAQPVQPAPAATLAGTRWVGIVDKSIPAESAPRLELVEEGRLAGYTGCNMMSGAWKLEGVNGRVGRIITTKRACLGPGSEVESRVMAALGENARLTREGERLVATGPNGERFEFTAAP
jgi:heat shock protein HslJ